MAGKTLRRLRGWLSDTSVLIHLSSLFFVAVVIVGVVELSLATHVSYLVFPPLAAATFALFYDPEGMYSDPASVVVGLTLGALMGWISFVLLGFTGWGAALGVLLTGLATWLTGSENPAAFSATLLAIVLRTESFLYVVSVFAATVVVAGVFHVWKTRLYRERANYLYESTWGDDHVLVPLHEPDPPLAELAARIAAAHEGGKVVLLGLVDGEGVDAESLEGLADDLRRDYGVEVEASLVEVVSEEAGVVVDAAERYSCDLIAVEWSGSDGEPSDLAQSLYATDIDVAVYRHDDEPPDWESVLVPVRGDNELSHLMVDLALRLVGEGVVSVSTYIEGEGRRRKAERLVSSLIDGFQGRFETHVANVGDESPATRIVRESRGYDAVVLGASTDRPVTSRLLSPPTAEQILGDVQAPVVVVHSGEASRHRVPWLLGEYTGVRERLGRMLGARS